MIDWSARIDDLCDKLSREYTIEDRTAVEILLAGLVNCPRTASCWLVLETNWFARESLNAWFSFGELWVPCSLPRLRVRSPWREIESETREWLDSLDYVLSKGGPERAGRLIQQLALHARRADRFWLLGYTTMFLAPSLVLFLISLTIVASIWLALWLLYLFFVIRYFPGLQTPRTAE